MNSQVDEIYTHLSKALDTINHDMLLRKLNTFGFARKFLEVTSSY